MQCLGSGHLSLSGRVYASIVQGLNTGGTTVRADDKPDGCNPLFSLYVHSPSTRYHYSVAVAYSSSIYKMLCLLLSYQKQKPRNPRVIRSDLVFFDENGLRSR